MKNAKCVAMFSLAKQLAFVRRKETKTNPKLIPRKQIRLIPLFLQYCLKHRFLWMALNKKKTKPMWILWRNTEQIEERTFLKEKITLIFEIKRKKWECNKKRQKRRGRNRWDSIRLMTGKWNYNFYSDAHRQKQEQNIWTVNKLFIAVKLSTSAVRNPDDAFVRQVMRVLGNIWGRAYGLGERTVKSALYHIDPSWGASC